MADPGDGISIRLRSAVLRKYGRSVSAARIARDLQIWSRGHFFISPEGVRKWLTGKSAPRFEALIALEGFFECRFTEQAARPCSRRPVL
jgi:hypothetical protein